MSEEEGVIAANERYYQAFAGKDFPAMQRAWARRGPLACTHPGWMTLLGREAVMASWARILSNPGQPRIVPGGAVAAIFGEVATVHCREFVAGSQLVATNLFVREDGEWRMVDHHASPVAAAASE